METVLSAQDIMSILPHRYPFLLVDRVVELKDGEEGATKVGHFARTLKSVTMNEPFFQGHFPDFPIMPGVLLVEAMAQTAALAYYRPKDPQLNFMIAGIEKARFRKPVVPGDRLEMTAKILKDRRNMILTECQASVDGQVVAEVTMLAAISLRTSSGTDS
jgi:3-hydroxyacyl-[acyl-carrier-protein] dehydratase